MSQKHDFALLNGQVPSSDFPPFQGALKGHQTLNEITAQVIARIFLRHFIWVQYSYCGARQTDDLGTKMKDLEESRKNM